MSTSLSLLKRSLPRSTRSPYTTLFRSSPPSGARWTPAETRTSLRRNLLLEQLLEPRRQIGQRAQQPRQHLALGAAQRFGHHGLDQVRAGGFKRALKCLAERAGGGHALAGHAHAARQVGKVQLRAGQLQLRTRLGAAG